MMKLSKILLPVDFSEQGVAAAAYAAGLARHFQAELTLLHVNPLIVPALITPREFSGPIDTGWITALEAQRRRDLACYQAGEFRDVNLKRVVTTGDPAQQIVEHAHGAKTDLIVMPTHGYGPFRRFLLGSVTAKVLHDAECPVWTGSHLRDTSAHGWRPVKQVLCAVDIGPASERVLDWAWRFAGAFAARLAIVHAIPKLEPPMELLEPDAADWRAEPAAAQIRCLQTKTGASGEVVIEGGDPSEVVANTAAEMNADMVVIGRSPAKGRLRTNAYSIIRDSPCPVLSV
jgi:nucleotide-binding universal stress UspA family protein